MILATGDWHANSAWPMSRSTPSGMPSRFEEQLAIYEQIKKIVEERRPDLFVFGGDWTHRRYFTNMSTLLPLRRATIDITKMVSHTYVISGNHDQEDKQGLYTSVGVLEHVNKVTVVDSSATAKHKGQTYLFLAYSEDEQNMLRVIRSYADKDVTLFAHYAADGVVLESDYTLPSVLPREDLRQFQQVIFHHVHSPSDDGNIHYVGAPQHYDFGDVGPRFITMIHDDMTIERIPLEYPPFVTCRYPRIPAPGDGGGYLRILGVPHEHFIDVKEAAEALGWFGVIPVEDSTPREVIQLTTSAMVVNDEVLTEYVKAKYSELGDVEVSRIVKTGLDYLEKARSIRL